MLVGVASVVVVAAGIWARTDDGRAFLRDQLLALLAPAHGTLSAGPLATDLFSYAELRDITLAGPDGAVLAHVDTLRLGYRLGGLSSRVLVVPEARVDGLTLTLAQTDAGLDLAALWDDGGPPSTEPWTGLPIDLVLPAVAFTNANVTYRVGEVTYGLAGASLSGALALRGPAVEVAGLTLDAPVTTPALGPLTLHADGRWDPNTLWFEQLALALGPNAVTVSGGLGRLGAEPTVGVGITALHVEPESLAPLLGALPVTGAFDATGGVAGLLAAPTVLLEVRTPGGPVHVSAALDTRGPRPAWSGTLAPSDVALHTFLAAVPVPTVVRGGITFGGEGFGWPDDLDATATLALEAPRLGEWDTLALGGDLRLAKGVLGFDGVRASASGVALRGDGEVRLLDGTGAATLTESRVDLPVLRRFGVAGLGGAGAFRGDVRFGWGDALGVDADGDFRGTELTWGGLGRVGSASGPVAVAWTPASGVDATVDLALTNVAAAPSTGVTAGTATLDGTVTVAPSGALVVAGDVALGGVVAPGVVGQALTGTVALSRSSAGALDGAVAFATTAVTWEGWTSTAGTGRVVLAGDTATVTLDLRDGDRTMVGVDGEMDLAARSIRARRLVVAPTEALAWRNDGVLTVRLVDGGVADLRVRLVSGDSVLALEGFGARKERLDLRLDARHVRLDQLASLLPGRLDGYAGRVSLRASFEGPAAHPALLLDLTANGLAVPDVARRLDLDIQGVGGEGRLRIDGVASSGAQRLARIVGEVPFSLAIDAPGLVPDGDLDVRLILPAGDAAAWSAIRPGAPLPDFRASAEIALTGKLLDPTATLVAIVDAPVGQGGDWIRLDVDATAANGAVELRAVARERLERRLAVSGTGALRLGDAVRGLLGRGPAFALADPSAWLGELSLDVVPMRLPIQVLAGFVDGLPTRLTGDLSGGLHLGGTVDAPALGGALLLASGRLGDIAISPALVTVEVAEGGHTVYGNVGFGNKGAVTVSGFVPVAPRLGADPLAELARDGLALTIDGSAIPLTAVAAAWPELEAEAGSISVRGTVTGTVLDPVPDLDFGLVDGDFTLRSTGVRYAEARFAGKLGRDNLRVSDLDVRTYRMGPGAVDPGRITGGVTARREDDRPVFDGTVTLDRAWLLDVPERTLRMSGKLRLGERAGKLRLSGTLAVVDGKLVVPERFFTGSSDLALPPDVRVLRRGDAPRLAERRAETAFTFPDWLDAEVSIALERSAFLAAAMPMEQMFGSAFRSFSSIELSSQLDGAVVARVADGALSIVGEVQPVRGSARVFGRPFELEGGSLSFTGLDYTDPVLDLVAVHTNVEYGAITTTITGTPSRLQLGFDAADDTLAPDDILSVLVLGRPSSEIAAGEGDALAGITTLLIEGSLGAVNQQAAEGGVFDVFEIGTTGIRIGRRLSGGAIFKSDLFLVGEYDWSADALEENVVDITLEWRVGRFWQVDLTTGTSGFSSLSWNRRWRF